MNTRDCSGLVGTLRGQKVLFTGKVTVGGSHMDRVHCRRRVLDLGGQAAPDSSGSVTLLIHGDFAARSLTDLMRGYSQKLVFVERMMWDGGPHIHVIDSVGFEALLQGLPARCHHLRERNGVVHAEPIGTADSQPS